MLENNNIVKKGLLLVISGPSGAGKGTICKELLEKHPDFWLSVSATTREPRKNEEHGKNYFFMTKEDFLHRLTNDDFLESAEVYGNYYGTPRESVISKIEEGKDVILEIDIQGALKVKESYQEGVFIFILPPSMDELKRRIIKRGSETEESLMRRFKSAYKEVNYVSKYNYAVMNDEVSEAVKKIESIIIAEKCSVERMKDNILSKEGIIHEQLYD
jgi:guanylate kinase